jgi:ABC-type branched-subunit amino acid transport system substrate-binding protein
MRWVHDRRVLPAIAVGAVLALVAGCSSTSGATSASGSGDPGGSGTGSVITLGGAGPVSDPTLSQPERKAAEEAAVAEINAAGGVNGHQLKLEYCDTQNNPNGELSCMRQLVQEKVSAIITPGLIADQSGRGYLVAAAAKIPVIGGQGLTPVEFATPGNFPIGSGIPGWAYGQVADLLKQGAKKIAFFGTTDPGSQYIIKLSQGALKSAHVAAVRTVVVDPSTDPTFASGAAKVMAGGVDGIVFDSSPLDAPRAIAALRAAGYKGMISSITAIFASATLKALGSQANGLLLTSQLALTSDTANAGVSQFLADMKKYQPGAQVNETSETSWAGVKLFAAVMKHASDLSSTATWGAFSNLSAPARILVAGPYQVKSATVYLKGYPRMYNPTVQNGVIKGGILTPDGKGFVNPFTTLTGMASGT